MYDVNEIIGEETAWQVGIGIDEDTHPEDAVLEGGQELPGRIWRAVALAFRPEVDPEGMDTESSELVRITGGGDAADLQGGRRGGKKAVEKRIQRVIKEVGG